MLPPDVSRCCGTRDLTTDAEVCPKRGDCECYAAWDRGMPDDNPANLWRCETDAFEARIPRPCAGALTRVSARPHPLCRYDCTRWKYGITGGITPRFIDQDGTASCADRFTEAKPCKS